MTNEELNKKYQELSLQEKEKLDVIVNRIEKRDNEIKKYNNLIKNISEWLSDKCKMDTLTDADIPLLEAMYTSLAECDIKKMYGYNNFTPPIYFKKKEITDKILMDLLNKKNELIKKINMDTELIKKINKENMKKNVGIIVEEPIADVDVIGIEDDTEPIPGITHPISMLSGDITKQDISSNSLLTVQQWSVIDGNAIIPVSNTFDTLEAGYYTIHSSQQIGMYFIKEKVELNKLYRLPNAATDLILNDISKFWTLEDTYKRYQRVFRRNYLLYSAPGTGKTSLINLMCQELIEKYNGIVISLSDSSEIQMYTDAVRRIRSIEPDRKIITIIEDIDNFIGDEYSRSSLDTYLLNILDGNMKIGGIVTIATTNFIEKIESRYKNRPSRFDRVVEFPLPNDESRKMFIEKTVDPIDLHKIDIEKWVKRTDGYTIDHINELILLFFVFGHSEEESFETMDNMVKRNSTLKNIDSVSKKPTIGFKTEVMKY